MSPRRDRPEPPRLKTGQYLSREALAHAAAAAMESAGLTHEDAAERLDVKRTAITRAVNPDTSAGVALCARIVSELTDYRIDHEAPFYRVERG